MFDDRALLKRSVPPPKQFALADMYKDWRGGLPVEF
jgi:hypothetical protein